MKGYNGFTAYQRQQAWDYQVAEMAAGRLAPPQACGCCGQTSGRLEYHAEDYNWPFGPHLWAFPVCFRCHMVIHNRLNRPEGFARYREVVAAGGRFAPAASFGEVWGQLCGSVVPGVEWGPVPERDVLGEIAAGLHVPGEIRKPPRGWRTQVGQGELFAS